MRKNLGLIFTAILLCASLNAQNTNDTILAAGNPPLTQTMVNQLIDFFEFGLHGKFTDAQRAEFQKQRIAEWQSGDAGNKETIFSLLEMRSKLLAMNDGQLKEAQSKLQAYLVENFSKQPNEPTARLLMQVYKNGNGDRTNNNPVAGGSVNPSGLLGTWQAGTVSGVSFVNQTNGSTTNGGGTQVLYTFHPNGTYEYAALTTQTMYNCHTEFMTYKTGTVAVNGNQLTFIPKTSKFTSKDSCSTRNNYEKPAGLERETYNWSVQRDENGTKLCLQNDAVNGCAYKR
jgi:hypothetical protein